ncbi:MAG: hypothetical protein ACLGIO_04225 [Acidimicrobiia bacterium]
MASSDVVSALVVLRPAGGRPLDGSEQITAATVERFTADPGDAARVRAWFAGCGFDTAPAGPLAVSIVGPAALFEERFGTTLHVERVPAGMAVTCDEGAELPLGGLPATVRSAVSAVAFESPPDFGPGAP